MSKLGLMDNVQTVMTKMSEGNPGALSVCMHILSRGQTIDPDGFMGGLGVILLMDTFEIYGSRIWMLCKDCCGGDLIKMIAMIRACQLGMLSQSKLSHAIDNYGEGVDVEDYLLKVQKRLPNFGK